MYDNGVVDVSAAQHANSALRASDGHQLGTYEQAAGGSLGDVLATNDGALYVGSDGAQGATQACLETLDASSGTLRWHVLLPGPALGSTVVSGVAYIGIIGGLFAVDTGTGAVRWHQGTGAQVAYYQLRVVDGADFDWSEDQQLHSASLCFFWTCSGPALREAKAITSMRLALATACSIGGSRPAPAL